MGDVLVGWTLVSSPQGTQAAVLKGQLVEAQAVAAGLPLIPLMLPYPCTNQVYEDRMKVAIAEAKTTGVTHIAFGDLFLQDIREYRIRLLDGTGIEPQFPI